MLPTSRAKRKLDKSTLLYERAQRCIAGGISSSMRGGQAALFFTHGRGSRLFDVDGNEYIDFSMGGGPLILGHSPEPVIQAVEEQLQRGLLYGGEHELEVEVAECLQSLIPCAEIVRFTNSGSEAVHYAIRTARGYTGRSKVIKFEGQYHGGFDNVLASVSSPVDTLGPREHPVPVPESEGIPSSALIDLIVLPWNDLALLEQTLEEHAAEIAAVIMTPLMVGYGGNIFPLPGYVEGVRDLCTKHGIVLIFDEILCGFWCAPGGAQEVLSITADLATYAKALAAGMPIGCIAGKREMMEGICTGRVLHPGTYNAHPVSMAAAKATLEILSAKDRAIYRQWNSLRSQLMAGLEECARRRGVPLRVCGIGGLMQTSFVKAEIHDYRGTVLIDRAQHRVFGQGLAERGVKTRSYHWFISAAHSQQDINRTIEAADMVLSTLRV